MELYLIFLIIHLFAFAWGVGGATASDILFLKSIRDRIITKYEYSTLKTVSNIVILGIVMAILSGAALLYNQFLGTGEWGLLSDPRFQMKVTLVGLIVANGFIFHGFVFPLMKRYRDKSLDNPEVNSKLWLFALTGAVSITSWYGAALLALIKSIQGPYLLLLGIYLLILLVATIFAYLVLARKLSTVSSASRGR